MPRPIKITSFAKGVEIEFTVSLDKSRDVVIIQYDDVSYFESYPNEDIEKSFIKIHFKNRNLDLNYQHVSIDGSDMTSHTELRETFRNLLLT